MLEEKRSWRGFHQRGQLGVRANRIDCDLEHLAPFSLVFFAVNYWGCTNRETETYGRLRVSRGCEPMPMPTHPPSETRASSRKRPNRAAERRQERLGVNYSG